jgi:hypothetical protein
MKLRTLISLPLLAVLLPFVWLVRAFTALKRRRLDRRYKRFKDEAPEVAAWIDQEIKRKSSFQRPKQ